MTREPPNLYHREIKKHGVSWNIEKEIEMKAIPIEMKWHPGFSIFAKESFLKVVGDEYGWLGGIDDSGTLRCILPYTIVRKAIFRMVRFRVETLYLNGEISIEEEKAFLNSVVDYFRSTGADMIIPAATNAIFRAYPDGADAAPYGSYIIDLTKPEDVLWKNIDRIYRQNINTAIKAGVSIRDGAEHIEATYVHVRDTFRKSKLPFMNYESFKRFVHGLGDNGKLMIADYQGVVQSYVVFASSDFCAYAIYAGNLADLHQGANKLLYWEAIKYYKNLGVQRFDFVGARINPEKGSKQEGLSRLKKRYGANLKQGYMWKYSIHPLKYRLYCMAARYRSGGDIVDGERHKLKDVSPT
jgi:hypothetical protein